MYKILWFLKRKPGITFEQFRDHYENSHSVLGQKYIGHLLLKYERNYNVGTSGGTVLEEGAGANFGPRAWEYDCVTEWITADEAAFNKLLETFKDPEIGKLFYDDEEHFLDRKATMLFKCDARNTGPGDGAEALKIYAARAKSA